MLHYRNTTIATLHFQGNVASLGYKGSILVFEGVRSCYGSGAWLNDKGWLNDDGWRNG
jgi:hypothetical protein